MDSITIKMSYQGFPVEMHIEPKPSQEVATLIIEMIDGMKSRGFTAPVSYRKSGDDKIGMKGIVEGIQKGDKTKTGLQMYIVNGKLEDGQEFSWNEFTATTFRKGDTFKIAKNDRGFLAGEIILPDMKGSDDIPF